MMKHTSSRFMINNRFEVLSQLGEGSFSHVFFGTDLYTNINVAIKMENKSNRHPLLKWESEVLSNLQRSHIEGIPRILWFGTKDDYNILVMEKGGSNLSTCLEQCEGGRMRLKTVARLAMQMIGILCRLHDCGYVHRDIKPENFILKSMRHPVLFGRAEEIDSIQSGQKSNISSSSSSAASRTIATSNALFTIFLIDFGLTTSYLDSKGLHINNAKTNRFIGTLAFASLSTSQGQRHSRRDDLESIVNCLIYLFSGSLPWQRKASKNEVSTDQYYDRIMKIKSRMSIDEICSDLPPVFRTMYQYVRKLDFSDRPSYRYLQDLWRCVITMETQK